jgi:hypothetical protein
MASTPETAAARKNHGVRGSSRRRQHTIAKEFDLQRRAVDLHGQQPAVAVPFLKGGIADGLEHRRGSRRRLWRRTATLSPGQRAGHRQIDVVRAELTESDLHICAELQVAEGDSVRLGDIETSLPGALPREHIDETGIEISAQERARLVNVTGDMSHDGHHLSMTPDLFIDYHGWIGSFEVASFWSAVHDPLSRAEAARS